MSQYIRKLDGDRGIQFGWDPPMQTFYAQVYKVDQDGERLDYFEEDGQIKDGTLVWLGVMIGEIYDLDDFIMQMAPHYRFNNEERAALYKDRDEGL